MKKRYIAGLLLVGVFLFAMVRGPLGARISDTSEVENAELSSEEIQEYTKLSSKNAKAREFFEDLKVFALVSNSLADLFPTKQVASGIEIPLRDIMKAIVGALYNVSELGLGLIKISNEQAEPLKKAAKCLLYTDQELKQAAQGILATQDIEICTKAGYTTKKKVLAGAIMMTADASKIIFDNAFIKYDTQTEKAERGLLFNIDFVVDNIVSILLQSTKFQEALNNLGKPKEAVKTVDSKDQLENMKIAAAYKLLEIAEGVTRDEVEDAYDAQKAKHAAIDLAEASHETKIQHAAKLKQIEDARSTLSQHLIGKQIADQLKTDKPDEQAPKKEIPSSNLDKVKAFRKHIEQLRSIMTIAGTTFSGILQAMVAVVAAIEPSAVPEAKRQEYKEAFVASQELIIPSDDVLDTIVFFSDAVTESV